MTSHRMLLGVACLLGLVFTASTSAQQRVSPEDQAMDTLRIGRPTEGDNDIVDNWINKELGILRQALADPVLMDRAGADFVAAFMRQWNHPENTAEFKIKFAERVGVLFLREYRKAEELNERLARALARVLLNLESAFTRDTLIAGLSFPDQAVRYLSAQALREIQDDLAADAGTLGQTLAAVAQAGASESSDVVVARIYRAVQLDGFPQESLNAVFTILEGRLGQLRGGA